MKEPKHTYQQLKAQLDEVLMSLESEDLDVDEATKAYEKGLALLKQLEGYLAQAENRIKVVSKSSK